MRKALSRAIQVLPRSLLSCVPSPRRVDARETRQGGELASSAKASASFESPDGLAPTVQGYRIWKFEVAAGIWPNASSAKSLRFRHGRVVRMHAGRDGGHPRQRAARSLRGE